MRLRTQVVGARGADRLEGLTLEDVGTGQREALAAAAVFVLIGAAPHTERLCDLLQRDDHGYILTGDDVPRPAWPFETSLPGVFAVGEGPVAVGSVHRYQALLNDMAIRSGQ